MKWISGALAYLGLYIIWSASFGAREGYSFTGFLVAVLFASPLLLISAWCFSKAEGDTQTRDDETARYIVEQNATSAAFFLYLRPFSSTNKLRLSDAHLNLFSWETWERDGFDDLERMIARALKPTAPLIALGRPGEHRGAGRASTEEQEWRAKVKDLAARAELVFVMPSNKAGTLLELELIAEQQYLNKTIFVMPPSESAFYESSGWDIARDWSEVKRECKNFGIDLPEHRPAGMLFKLRQKSHLAAAEELPFPDAVRWMKSIQRLIDA
ncbi:hypothetical protein [Acidovorax sp. RAC01]|uniref:hypothetical protein n=1 Tax=Acidovorax sp. RAC01 TaxID=1842533 RepID=UPI00083E9200|nr:hypothetical protein [Acidovorax sp. RAC01]AOG23925.1 hypothetical protein BSY15_3304 [Acidovorax sp. RAC01]